MIISHKLKVIHIKLRKVAGTSFEIAFSKYCGPDDIITELVEEDEKTRTSLSYIGAQNNIMQNEKLISHTPASQIKATFPDVFNNYLKIAIMRNPYQQVISWYFWYIHYMKRQNSASFKESASRFCENKIELGLIHIKGKLVVDVILRYEHLIEDIKKLERKIACPGLAETFASIKAKADIRPPQETSLYEMYSKNPEAKQVMDQFYYDNLDKYELLENYWLPYKTELENILSNPPNKKNDYFT